MGTYERSHSYSEKPFVHDRLVVDLLLGHAGLMHQKDCVVVPDHEDAGCVENAAEEGKEATKSTACRLESHFNKNLNCAQRSQHGFMRVLGLKLQCLINCLL